MISAARPTVSSARSVTGFFVMKALTVTESPLARRAAAFPLGGGLSSRPMAALCWPNGTAHCRWEEGTMVTRYDAIVIGTGQSGPPLASRLADEGMRVAVIER